MLLEKQITSIELSRRLKKLGVKQDSYFKWVDGELWDETQQSDYETNDTVPRSKWIAAFTVAELGEITGEGLIGRSGTHTFTVGYEYRDHILESNETHYESADTEADARAKMLIYLVENGLWTPKFSEGV